MKRVLAGATWLFVLLWTGNYVSLATGLPTILPATIAAAFGIFVTLDPWGRIWEDREARPSPVTTESYTVSEALGNS